AGQDYLHRARSGAVPAGVPAAASAGRADPGAPAMPSGVAWRRNSRRSGLAGRWPIVGPHYCQLRRRLLECAAMKQALLAATGAIVLAATAQNAYAQGCVLIRQAAPVIGSSSSTYLRPGEWQ